MENIKTLKYTGSSHVQSFVKADFQRHEVEDQGAVKWDGDNNWVAEVSDDAAELLFDQFPREFREATEEDISTPDLTRVGSKPKTAFGKAARAAARAKVEQVDASTADQSLGEGVRTSQGSAGSTGTSTGGRSRARST